MTIDELDRAYAQLVLRTTGGNKQRAASLLGVDRRTLQRWSGKAPAEAKRIEIRHLTSSRVRRRPPGLLFTANRSAAARDDDSG
jgi:hypothetical protein